MRVLVLDGNENQAVACVRSLGRAGHRVEVGSPSAWSKAGWSRFARATWHYPAPQSGATPFVDAVVAELRRSPERALVLPMTERSTLPLSADRARVLAAGGTLILPSHETVLRAYDKSQTTALAASLGIDVPTSTSLSSPSDAAAFAQGARWPVVLKPVSSEEVGADGRTVSTGAPQYARSRDEFEAACGALLTRSRAVLVQEYVEGSGAGYFALAVHGSVRAEFAHRRVRDVRPSGSGSAVRVSVAPDPRVRDAARQLLRALGWHGVAMVEFRIRPDGVPVFLEVNGRFWNSLALAVYAGADFPRMLAELAERGDVAPLPPYTLGLRCRWLLGDFRHLAAVWAGRPRGYDGPWPRRLTALRDFLLPVPGTFHDNFTLDDPLPEVGDWVDFFGRRVPHALKRR